VQSVVFTAISDAYRELALRSDSARAGYNTFVTSRSTRYGQLKQRLQLSPSNLALLGALIVRNVAATARGKLAALRGL
jgi:hypothetical protein